MTTVTNYIFSQQSTYLDSQELHMLESSDTEHKIAMHVTFEGVKGRVSKISNEIILRMSR